MAADEAVMEAFVDGFAPPTLRFYGWSVPSVTIGRLQPFESVPEGWGSGVVRRPTGGRAVDHRNDLTTFSIIVGADDLGSPVQASYRRIGDAVARALRHAGIGAEFCRNTTVPSSVRSTGNCFDLTLDYELSVGSRKVLGSAQVRSGGAVLQQNSLVLSEMDAQPERTAIEHEIVRQLSLEFGVKIQAGELSETELQNARHLADNKYATEAWNRTPARLAR